MFLVHHIDSVLQVLVGLFFTWFGYHRRPGVRSARVFRVCGPALIVIGGLLFFKPDATPRWQIYATTDGVARAEFPGTATAQESTDTLGAVSVKRTSFTYSVPGKDLTLFLSYSALPADARAMTDAQRLDGTVNYFASQGFVVTRDQPTGPVHRFTVRQNDKKTTVRMALAYVGDSVYRTVASYADGSEDQALVERFMASFHVR